MYKRQVFGGLKILIAQNVEKWVAQGDVTLRVPWSSNSFYKSVYEGGLDWLKQCGGETLRNAAVRFTRREWKRITPNVPLDAKWVNKEADALISLVEQSLYCEMQDAVEGCLEFHKIEMPLKTPNPAEGDGSRMKPND